jgi:hypothetical protein
MPRLKQRRGIETEKTPNNQRITANTQTLSSNGDGNPYVSREPVRAEIRK